ncbi:MAG TPA: glycosyltransferase family A protein [Candidatus Hydrogenedentes bacterium]|nr:glycosyltransferase family A protein [Candidatus Hydrogenedentota bacterium]
MSFVVIGYNEAATLKACLESVKTANLDGFSWELIYVDGGSTDDSMEIARETGVNLLLGGEMRRRAAENRNLGLSAARGRLVQFIDGDMTLSPDWPRTAAQFLSENEAVAAVCGNLEESAPGVFYAALQIDWAQREGEIRHCGGAAMYVAGLLREAGAFPTEVAYGEEPLLCWRLRNILGRKIYQINQTMARHNLDFRGLRDYWRRNVRCGQTYAEIAAICWRTPDPLWRRECLTNAGWALLMFGALAGLIIGTTGLRVSILAVAGCVLARKFAQTRMKGHAAGVSLMYAVHSYFSKLSIAWGELRWVLRRDRRKVTGP